MREQIAVAPMQWAPINYLQDVEPLNDQDSECLAEIREVLKKHGKLDRFALYLVHKHFDLSEDEILCEYTDPESRTLTMIPKNKMEIPGHVETTWMLNEIGPLTACIYACYWPLCKASHNGRYRELLPINFCT
ncbi:hypothetical protein [Methylomonas rhizoryzae]|uniref:hypothetical protein n=1 Tax=Methylomonas rhizoryzae TaxID=2608981 RepID=UPI0012327336|nr:hypothetical protein [Methylomonas rhizoryzae]